MSNFGVWPWLVVLVILALLALPMYLFWLVFGPLINELLKMLNEWQEPEDDNGS